MDLLFQHSPCKMLMYFACIAAHKYLTLELGDGGRPDGQNEGDLVDEISNVVDEIEDGGRHGAGQEAEEISEGIDAPADGHDGAHGVEGLLDGRGGVSAGLQLASLAVEDLVEDVEPAHASEDETGEGVDGVGLTHVAEQKHADGADEETPEDATGGRANRAEDEVELDHLERDGDAPIDVTVDGGGLVIGDPVLTHVEVMDGGDECDEGTGGQRDSPVARKTLRLHEEEHGGGNHRNGDDPERDTDGVMGTDPLGLELAVQATDLAGGDAFLAAGQMDAGEELVGQGISQIRGCKGIHGEK